MRAESKPLQHISLNLPGIFRHADSDPVKINNETIGSLFWADDILLISETAHGLQKSLKKLEDYC